MNILKYKIGIVLSLVLLFATSCDKDFSEINTNPNVATSIDPGYQFSYTLLRTSGERYENWRAVLIYSSVMIQHFATTCGYWSGDKYTYNSGYASSLFDRAYVQQVKEIQDLVNTLQKGEVGDATMLGMARIWRVVIFHRLTDMYGDVPYSEAGLGAISGIDFPKYDSQESIYKDMLKELEEAVAQIGTGGFGSSDFIYGGDTDKWKKFGNSLMLRLAMRLSEVDPGTAQSYAAKAIAGGIMEDNSDDAFLTHTNGPEGINKNGIGEVLDRTLNTDNCPRLSNTMVDFLMSTSDPRLDVLGETPESGGGHKGMPNGLDATTIQDNPTGTSTDDFDRVNRNLTTVSSPMMFMTAAEAQLLAAEAAVRGWTGGSAADYYNQGVKNAMQQWAHYTESAAISDDAVNAYLAANPFDSGNAMKQIGWQYWMATFLNEYEAYSNYRRTGIPELTPVNYTGNVTNGQIPKRLVYPQSEAGRDNFEAAKAAQGLSSDFSSYMSVPVWWDVN